MHLRPLTPYRPELNPVEGLLDPTKNVTSNKCFNGLGELEETLTEAGLMFPPDRPIIPVRVSFANSFM